MTNEQIAKFCGFKPYSVTSNRIISWIKDGVVYERVPDFYHDLNACEKYVFSKLKKLYLRVQINIFSPHPDFTSIIIFGSTGVIHGEGTGNTICAALLTAIEPIITSKEDF